MESINQCHCCLQRPSAKELSTPYPHLGITEIYSAMIEECFVIKLTSTAYGESGICERCLGRLREACFFKMQVQNCQAELRDRYDGGLCVKEEDCEELDDELPESDACSESSRPRLARRPCPCAPGSRSRSGAPCGSSASASRRHTSRARRTA
ncbi:uncharacterized protein LOC125240059 isoform X2 [Leguminivora glycinivorella]|uniref:uncharacterized protein LOC125240059 isoform X2 n=1 Tax=Leguminivora glycinivorella TaxID=1035111 RepID=UPI002010BD31|nr:uncharacterized protein LOC125240059 isoform X2 [Leguminivora glycinivorella]